MNSCQVSHFRFRLTAGFGFISNFSLYFSSPSLRGSRQDLKEKILDQPDEACPTNIPAVLLAQFSDKQGEGATKDNLTGGVPRQAQS